MKNWKSGVLIFFSFKRHQIFKLGPGGPLHFQLVLVICAPYKFFDYYDDDDYDDDKDDDDDEKNASAPSKALERSIAQNLFWRLCTFCDGHHDDDLIGHHDR